MSLKSTFLGICANQHRAGPRTACGVSREFRGFAGIVDIHMCACLCVHTHTHTLYRAHDSPRARHFDASPHRLRRTLFEAVLGSVRARALAGASFLDLCLCAEHRPWNDALPVVGSVAARACYHFHILRPRIGQHDTEDGRGREDLEDDAPDI